MLWTTPALLFAFLHRHMVRAFHVRVASYNVLSSHLARVEQYPTLNPEHLKASNRLLGVLRKLDDEVAKKSIICLQEVSHDWAGALHTYFANQGYHLVTGLYGKKFNGYMGVAIAWPLDTTNVLKVDISRLSDKRAGGWPREPKKGIITRSLTGILRRSRDLLEKIFFFSRATDHWTMAEHRNNILISIQLQDKLSGNSFVVSTYHMPCAFYAPMVMTLHADLAAQHVQSFAGEHPFVLAGDWNIKPYDSTYNLLTTGMMDLGHPNWPTPKHETQWTPSARPMRSAYAESQHGEPDFTNYARVKEEEPFIDTLDYIFLSDHWDIDGVAPLPKRENAQGPFPNLEVSEPSDHLLIAADLSLRM